MRKEERQGVGFPRSKGCDGAPPLGSVNGSGWGFPWQQRYTEAFLVIFCRLNGSFVMSKPQLRNNNQQHQAGVGNAANDKGNLWVQRASLKAQGNRAIATKEPLTMPPADRPSMAKLSTALKILTPTTTAERIQYTT